MRLTKQHSILLIVLIILLPFVILSAWDITIGKLGVMKPFFKDYQLTGTNEVIELFSDGTVKIGEEIGYRFQGCFKEVYRTPHIARYPSPIPYIHELDAYCEPSCSFTDYTDELIGYFGEICDQDAKFLLGYDIRNGLTIGRDVVEFHYKLWGDEWEKPLHALHGDIFLPPGVDASLVEVFFNPLGIVDDVTVYSDRIRFSAGLFSDYLEVRVLMPRSGFDEENGQFLYDSSLTLDNSIRLQEVYSSRYNDVQGIFAVMVTLLVLFMIGMPLLVYYFLGQEPRIKYRGIFERSPVKGLAPYQINSLVMGMTGDTDRNAIPATLLDLIRRKHIKLQERMVRGKGYWAKRKKSLILIFVGNNKDKLSEPEEKLMSFFLGHTNDNGELIWSEFIAKLKRVTHAKDYVAFADTFEEEVDKSYDIKQYFDGRGHRLFSLLNITLFIVGFITLIYFGSVNLHGNFPFVTNFYGIMGLIAVYAVIGFFISNRVFGRFTVKGYEVYKKSMNFRKFMTDMTQLKDHPPASIVLWEHYLVYATLFGVADQVIKQMKIVVPDTRVRRSSLYPMYTGFHVNSLASAYSTSTSTLSSSSSGGGGIGGGFGGGGGGAR